MGMKPRPVQVVDLVDHRGYRFAGITEASEWLGVSKRTLYHKMYAKNPIRGRWVARFADQFYPPIRRDKEGK